MVNLLMVSYQLTTKQLINKPITIKLLGGEIYG